MTQRLVKIKTNKVRCPNSKLVINGPKAQNENKRHSSLDKIGRLHVPSIIHQKIKFVTEEQLVYVSAEDDMIAATSSRASYVKIDEKVIEYSFRSLEFVNTMYVGE